MQKNTETVSRRNLAFKGQRSLSNCDTGTSGFVFLMLALARFCFYSLEFRRTLDGWLATIDQGCQLQNFQILDTSN